MALAALLSSLALFAAGPSTMVLAQADAAPAAAARAPDPADDENALPSGAPDDDYGLVAWCYGALSGHEALYDQVLPEVRRIESAFPDSDRPIDKVMGDYTQQHAVGRRILIRYGHALDILEQTGKANGADRAAAVARGREAWKGSETADPRQLAQLWMSWGLPRRCQTTAARIAPAK